MTLLALLGPVGESGAGKPPLAYRADISQTADVPTVTWDSAALAVAGTVQQLGYLPWGKSWWETMLTGTQLHLTIPAAAYGLTIWVDDRLAVAYQTRTAGGTLLLTFPTSSTRKVRVNTHGVTGTVTVSTPTGQSAAATAPKPWRIAIVGDSYIEGGGIAAQLGIRLDANVASLGVGGTGYQNRSPEGHYSSANRLGHVAAFAPDIVISTGSWNDSITPELSSYIEQMWYRVVTLPTHPWHMTCGSDTAAHNALVRDTLAGRARYLGHTSPADWPLGPGDMEGAHPTAQGEGTWAAHIAQALVALQP